MMSMNVGILWVTAYSYAMCFLRKLLYAAFNLQPTVLKANLRPKSTVLVQKSMAT